MDITAFNMSSITLDPADHLRFNPASLQRAEDLARSPNSTERIHKAAQEFESYFISYLMKSMRETVPKGFLERKGEQVWYSFYDQEIARLATQAGGIGLTPFIEGQFPGR